MNSKNGDTEMVLKTVVVRLEHLTETQINVLKNPENVKESNKSQFNGSTNGNAIHGLAKRNTKTNTKVDFQLHISN